MAKLKDSIHYSLFTIHHSPFTTPPPPPYPLLCYPVYRNLVLYHPDPEQVKPCYEKRVAADPRTGFPYWAKIWPAARALAAFLEAMPDYTRQKKVLELGAGIGLPSFCIAGNAAQVIISDHDPDALVLLKKNIEWLKLENAKALFIDWNDFPPDLHADTILLSDVNYDPESFEALRGLILQWLEQGSTVMLATPQRIMSIPFIQSLTPYIQWQENRTKADPDGDTTICLLVLEKNGSDR